MLVSTVHADVNHYMPLQLIDPQDKLKDLSFDGSLFGASWKPLLVELVDESPYLCGDFATLETVLGVLVCNEKAITCLLPCLNEEIEILPLTVVNHSESYFIINILNVVDCLNEARSRIIRSVFSGRIIAIEEYDFFDAKINNALLFKVPQVVRKTVFSTSAFKGIVQDNRLSGLEFRPVTRGRVE